MWPDWAIYWTLGNFAKPLTAINLHKSSVFLGNFCKGVKIFNFSSGIIFGQLYRHLVTFYWSHWFLRPRNETGFSFSGRNSSSTQFSSPLSEEFWTWLLRSLTLWQSLTTTFKVFVHRYKQTIFFITFCLPKVHICKLFHPSLCWMVMTEIETSILK